MVQRMVPAAKIARADKISKSPSAPPEERPPARNRLQAPGSRTCDKKHRTEHPACPNRSKRGPDAPFTLRPSVSPPLAAPGHFLSVRTSLHLPPVLTPANTFPPFAPHQSSPHPAAPHIPPRPRRSPPSIRILALPPRAGNPFRARRPASAPCAAPEMSGNQRPNEKISAPHFAQSPFFVIFAPALSLINF